MTGRQATGAARTKRLARVALLLALALMLQSLRLIIPLPPFFSTFIIGSLVNACLLVALETAGIGAAAVIAALTPVAAYFQQLLFLPVFILPVAAANFIYALLFGAGRRWGRLPAVGLAAAGKAAFLYFVFVRLLAFVNIPPNVAAGLMFAMSWPQFFTGVAGGILAAVIVRKLKPFV